MADELYEDIKKDLDSAMAYQPEQQAKRYNEERRQLWLDPETIGLEERRRLVRRQEERERWEAFAQYVSDHRLAIGHSQSQCARVATLTQTKWSRIERAQFTVPIDAIPGIALALHIDSAEVYAAAGFTIPETPKDKVSPTLSTDLAVHRQQELVVLQDQLNRIENMLLKILGHFTSE